MGNNIIHKYYVIIFICFASNLADIWGQPEDLTLDSYYIEIPAGSLQSLYNSPYSNDYYDAEIIIENSSYICEIRFRGASARDLPKKSWKLKFPNDNNPFGSEKINFNAEYRDRSVMRNYLTNKLFEFCGEPASKIKFVNLYINNDYYGVFSQIEELEEDFLKRNNLKKGSVYKARSHSANFAPIPVYDRYFYPWDKQLGDETDYSELIQLINKLAYYNENQFTEIIENDIDLDNIINYFAIQFIIVGFDSFTKNYNLYIDKNGQSAKLFPWDNDATFGNLWNGNFIDEYIYNIDGNKDQNWECLRFNVLFQRLMEQENYRLKFNNQVDNIITKGFDFLHSVIDSTYDLISNDVHQDPFKRYSNDQFDDERDKLKYFLSERKKFLSDKDLFIRPMISNIEISDPFPNASQPVQIKVKLNRAADLFVDYITDYNLADGGREYTVKSMRLLDDGMSNDNYAGDLIYGTVLTFTENFDGVYPYTFRIGNTFYPANGFSYLEYGPTVSYALSPVNSYIDLANNLIIHKIYSYNEYQFVELLNKGNQKIDLTYFHIRADNGYDDFVFPAGTILGPGNSMLITNNKELAYFVFPDKLTLEYLSFQIELDDSIAIYSPANTFLNSKNIDEISPLELSTVDLVLNEVNYHSSDSLNTGDWIELYNPNTFPVRLKDWSFKDENNDNVYIFPGSAIMPSEGYFVLTQDVERFKSIHPDISAMGSFNFGINNSGETLRLFNENNIQVLDFEFNDETPWPLEADGLGYTLELLNPELDIHQPENWKSSKIKGGTPGQENSNYIVSELKEFFATPNKVTLHQNYPNPFNPETVISYDLPIGSFVKLRIYDVLGRLIEILVDKKQASGKNNIIFDADNLPSGVYFYELKTDSKVFVKKMMLLK